MTQDPASAGSFLQGGWMPPETAVAKVFESKDRGVGWVWNTCIASSDRRRAPDRKILLETLRSVLLGFEAHRASIEKRFTAEAAVNALPAAGIAAVLFPTALLSVASRGRLMMLWTAPHPASECHDVVAVGDHMKGEPSNGRRYHDRR